MLSKAEGQLWGKQKATKKIITEVMVLWVLTQLRKLNRLNRTSWRLVELSWEQMFWKRNFLYPINGKIFPLISLAWLRVNPFLITVPCPGDWPSPTGLTRKCETMSHLHLEINFAFIRVTDFPSSSNLNLPECFMEAPADLSELSLCTICFDP